MPLFRCLECHKIFPENADGETDTGHPRPMCPRCAEEIDLEELSPLSQSEAESLSDATGDPYEQL